MSDNGDCFYITHANGQTWIELGKEGTVDIFSTNSVNVRTQGTLNLHADQDINMYAGGRIKMKSKGNMNLESTGSMILNTQARMILNSKTYVGVNSNGSLALKSKSGSWDSAGTLNFKGSKINLNGARTIPVPAVPEMTDYKLPDTEFTDRGWVARPGQLATIVTRAPTHEPYPYHNKGVKINTNLNASTTTAGNPQTQLAVAQATTRSISNGLTAGAFVAEPPASITIGGRR
jgi:hypothetical protein